MNCINFSNPPDCSVIIWSKFQFVQFFGLYVAQDMENKTTKTQHKYTHISLQEQMKTILNPRDPWWEYDVYTQDELMAWKWFIFESKND